MPSAGSQYTYLYHVLLLRITTKQPFIHAYTSQLLSRMLDKSILFQHHPEELLDWLTALPYMPDKELNVESRARLLTQQLYLLNFLDDCFRRAMKTPYRYIDELVALWPHFTPSQARLLPSPVVMAIVEQFRAKLVGEHISTEAASVVLNYMRRILVTLMAKSDKNMMSGIIDKLGQAVRDAKAKGQARPGLDVIVARMKKDAKTVLQGEEPEALETGEDIVELEDHE